MENQIHMDQQIVNKENLNGRQVLFGLFVSFVIFILIFFLARFYGALAGLGNPSGSESKIYIFIFFLTFVPFLILNNFIFIVSKTKSFKRGLLLGNLFVLLVFMEQINYFVQSRNILHERENREAAVQTNDEASCMKLKNNPNSVTRSRDLCLQSIAQVKKDSSICDKIEHQAIRNNCYTSVANILESLKKWKI